jgi:endonuclease III
MKNSNEYATHLRRLMNRLQRSFGAPGAYETQGPVAELILACLSENTTEAKARQAQQSLQKHFVDYNEMRVCRESELSDVLGDSVHEPKQVAKKILASLQQVFERCDSFDLENFQSKSKREAKDLLGNLETIGPYVAARVMLCAFKAHTFPVHEPMLAMLRHEEVVDPDADAAEVQGFLERHISSSAILKTYVQLRHYCDAYQQHPPTEPKKKNLKAKKTPKAAKKK